MTSPPFFSLASLTIFFTSEFSILNSLASFDIKIVLASFGTTCQASLVRIFFSKFEIILHLASFKMCLYYRVLKCVKPQRVLILQNFCFEKLGEVINIGWHYFIFFLHASKYCFLKMFSEFTFLVLSSFTFQQVSFMASQPSLSSLIIKSSSFIE